MDRKALALLIAKEHLADISSSGVLKSDAEGIYFLKSDGRRAFYMPLEEMNTLYGAFMGLKGSRLRKESPFSPDALVGAIQYSAQVSAYEVESLVFEEIQKRINAIRHSDLRRILGGAFSRLVRDRSPNW